MKRRGCFKKMLWVKAHVPERGGQSLNYIKQLRLKEDLRLSHCFSMETLHPHEHDIPLVRGGHLEGPHVFGFLMHAFPSEIWSKTLKEIMGLENCIFESEIK